MIKPHQKLGVMLLTACVLLGGAVTLSSFKSVKYSILNKETRFKVTENKAPLISIQMS